MLCSLQVAYHGIPDKAYEVFVAAQKSSSLSKKVAALEAKNPAGTHCHTHTHTHTHTHIKKKMMQMKLKKGIELEDLGIDPSISCMQSERSSI